MKFKQNFTNYMTCLAPTPIFASLARGIISLIIFINIFLALYLIVRIIVNKIKRGKAFDDTTKIIAIFSISIIIYTVMNVFITYIYYLDLLVLLAILLIDFLIIKKVFWDIVGIKFKLALWIIIILFIGAIALNVYKMIIGTPKSSSQSNNILLDSGTSSFCGSQQIF